MTTTTLKKQFLDYTGLKQFWGIIDSKFANKTDAVKVNSFEVSTKDEQGAPRSSELVISYTDSTVDKTGYSFTIPGATDTTAGLLSASDKSLIDTIDNKINDMAPFHGLKLSGKEVSLTGRRANIGLDFKTEGDINDGSCQAFIELVDLDYPAGEWVSILESEYKANETKANYHVYENKTVDPHTITYWRWDATDGSIVTGPTNNLGAPIETRAMSRIDVSELVKAGLLRDADVIVNNGAMYLKLVFITSGDQAADKEVLINVTDLVDIYTAEEGSGITIKSGDISADPGMNTGTSRNSTIELNLPVLEKDASGNITKNYIGGIRVGYDDTTTTAVDKQYYKVQLDATGNAFVAVPWEHTTVTAKTEGTGTGDKPYITVDVNETLDGLKRNFEVVVEAGDGIKNAEALAGTSVQDVKIGTVTNDGANSTVKVTSSDDYLELGIVQNTNETFNIGKDITLELTDSAKNSLALADTAVQNVTTTTVVRGDATHTPTGNDLVVELLAADSTEYADEKGEKTIKITLGEKTITSLNRADTALQKVKIMGTDIDIDDEDGYTVAEAKKALELGTAANVNTVEEMPNVEATEANKTSFQSPVLNANGENELRYTVATTYAVKKYVDSEISTLDQNLRGYVDDEIQKLDSTATVGTNTEYTYDALYKAAYGDGTTAQQIMIGVAQTDGKLVEAATPHTLSVSDIADFAPLSADQITAICTGTADDE